MILCEKEERQEISLLASFGYRHDFQQVSVRILKVEPTAAAPRIDTSVSGIVRSAAIRQAFRFDTREDAVVIHVAHVERVVMALICSRVIARVSPTLGFIGKSEREAVIHLYARKKAMVDFEPKDLSEELR